MTTKPRSTQTKTTRSAKAKSTRAGKPSPPARTTRARHRDRRPAGARPASHPPTGSRWLVCLTVAVVAVAALAAVLLTSLGGDGDGTTATRAFDRATSTADGPALAPLPDDGADPAVGRPAPAVEGQTRDGSALAAPATGRPTVLLFLAHWCPHCQREVPAVQEWVASARLPDGVDLVAVSTAADPSRPNFPASAWLGREGWNVPTVADADGTAAAAYGLTGFPFWVAVDDQGVVVERRSGELGLDQLRQLMTNASAAAP